MVKPMKYLDGQAARLGDQVDLGGGMIGVVVCCFDERLFSPYFTEEKWGDLKEGVLVNSQQAGLIHFAKAEIDLVLIKGI